MHDEPWWLGRLHGVARTKRGFKFCCPVHDDDNPSGYLWPGDKAWVIGCFAKCNKRDICHAIGLELEQLWYDHAPNKQVVPKITAVYDYRDEAGTLLFEVVRYEPKRFLNRRPIAKSYAWSLDGGFYSYNTKDERYDLVGGSDRRQGDIELPDVRRVLYRTEKLSRLFDGGRDPVIAITGGEKAVDLLWQIGIAATCCPHGEGKWREEYSKFLGQRRILVLPDNDEAGEAHAIHVVGSCVVVSGVTPRICRVPVPKKADVFDWLMAWPAAERRQKFIDLTGIYSRGKFQ